MITLSIMFLVLVALASSIAGDDREAEGKANALISSTQKAYRDCAQHIHNECD